MPVDSAYYWLQKARTEIEVGQAALAVGRGRMNAYVLNPEDDQIDSVVAPGEPLRFDALIETGGEEVEGVNYEVELIRQ